MSARGGVAGGVMSSVVGMYCTANLFAGCADGGADIALGRGGAIACLRRGVRRAEVLRAVSNEADVLSVRAV